MKRLIVIAALSTFFTSSVFAQGELASLNEGPYLGAGIGHSKLDNDTLDWLGDNNAKTDDTDVSYKLFAGYQFNPYVAVEAGYIDFGNYTAKWNDGANSSNLNLDFEGYTAALIGKVPIQSGFSLYGKLGMIAWDAELKGNAMIQTQGEDGTDPFYGIGSEYIVNNIVMRAEYERYDISESGEDFTIDMISGSLGYRF